MASIMNAPSRLPHRRGPKPSPFAGKIAIRRLIEAAKDAGLDVTGFKALPDGSVEILTGKPRAKGLFDELEEQGKL